FCLPSGFGRALEIASRFGLSVAQATTRNCEPSRAMLPAPGSAPPSWPTRAVSDAAGSALGLAPVAGAARAFLGSFFGGGQMSGWMNIHVMKISADSSRKRTWFLDVFSMVVASWVGPGRPAHGEQGE